MRILLGIGSMLATAILWPFRALMNLPTKVEEVFVRSAKDVRVEIPLTLYQNDYYGEVVFGTARPGEQEQLLRVAFDTASEVLWLAGSDSCHDNDCNGLPIKPFNGSKSSTYKRFKKQMTQGFAGSAALIGHLAQDHIKLGSGDKKKTAVVKNQLFGEAHTIKDMFQHYEALIGLGLVSPQLARGKPSPPIWHIAKSFSRPVFGFYIDRKKVGPNAGKLVIGGGDEDLYEGEFDNHPVVKKKKRHYMGWMIKIDSINMQRGGEQVDNMVLDDVLAVPDTGSSVFGGPRWAVDHINYMLFKVADIQYSKDATFPCDQQSKLPDVNFVINGKQYTFLPSDYVGKMKPVEKNICRTAFLSLDTPYFLLGHTFLHKYYTRFDVAKKEVQIAKAKHQTSASRQTP